MPDTSDDTFRPTRALLAANQVDGLGDELTRIRADLELRRRLPTEVTAGDLDWAEIYVGFRRPPVDGWGNVRWIHCIGAGVDGFLTGPPLPTAIRLTRSSEDFGPAIGEWCLTRALAECQQLVALAAAQRDRRWERDREPERLGGQRVLVLGTGLVGRGVARAFRKVGCAVDGLSRTGRAVAEFHSVRPAADFAAAIGPARWLVLAAPLTTATRHFVNRERLSRCGGAYLMNVGRGALIDEAVLPEALDRGWVRGAALDVFSTEPLPADSPLWAHPRVVVSPHVSGPSTIAATADGFLECLAAFERGDTPRWIVAPESGY
jgi:phosphoglycerate dehydrogenase-like enzyme